MVISADVLLTRAPVALGYSLWQSQEAHILGTHCYLPSVRFVLSSAASLILDLGREYVQLAILVVIKVFATIMAPIGMKQLLRYAFYSRISIDTLSVSLLVTSKLRGKVLSFDPGFGSRIFSWVLRSTPWHTSGTVSSRSVIGDNCFAKCLMRRLCFRQVLSCASPPSSHSSCLSTPYASA